MKYKDYYAVLEVPRDATLEQIKKAYRKLARQYHPDVSKDENAEAKFKDAAEAYATLKNPEKRSAYDELGNRPPDEEFSPPPGWSRSFGADAQDFGGADLADLLASMGHGRRGSARGPRPIAGQDFDTTAHISLEQAHHGTTITLELDDGGAARALEVTVPAGVHDGQKLRLRGKGGKARYGGVDGDIYLHIALTRHAAFRADGHDLYFDLALSPWEAALGAEVEIPTLDAPLLLTVPAGTKSGRKLRVRGRGLSNTRGGRGDFYAMVHIDVPAVLSERERALFQELANASHFNPRVPALKEPVNDHSTA
ncbi:MAG: DnaJ C-terminal domain-containing protein [Polaromonas sp.]|nr:DnaJ C-terminal domain-containing protein [Polaromonas sp.]